MISTLLTRRQFAVASLAFGSSKVLGLSENDGSMEAQLSPWSRGFLDIHHIDTGRGNSTFIIAPDGTTALIDCGTSNDAPEVLAPARPNESRRPGEWVARYALHHAQAAGRSSLDYLIASHIHPDHVGDMPPEPKQTITKGLVLTGVSEVDHLMPARVVIDRSYPNYGQLLPPNAPFAQNYLAWLNDRTSRGLSVERAKVGSAAQITLRAASEFPSFSIRVLSANGCVWTKHTDTGTSIFPDLSVVPPALLPDENKCSIALRLSYGDFSYFTGGDLTADTRDGRVPWLDVERAVVEACGRVEVAQADHHGYYDACGPAFTKFLDAQAYVIPAWHITHPGQMQLQRLLGAWPGVTSRDVFATEIVPANRLFNARFISKLRSSQGHVVVRVNPGGGQYSIFVLDSTVENGSVMRKQGPYQTRRTAS